MSETESGRVNDPGLYRTLSEPFEDAASCNAGIQAFFDEIDALRVKHRIADICVIVEVAVMADGQETKGTARLNLGSSANVLPMIARVYGEERQRHEDNLAHLIAAARRKAVKP